MKRKTKIRHEMKAAGPARAQDAPKIPDKEHERRYDLLVRMHHDLESRIESIERVKQHLEEQKTLLAIEEQWNHAMRRIEKVEAASARGGVENHAIQDANRMRDGVREALNMLLSYEAYNTVIEHMRGLLVSGTKR